MAVNGGAGNAISFSEIQAFYGGSNPISISEYNRGGSLVPASFAGASTATTANGAGTKNDFGITQTSQTVYTGSLSSVTPRVTGSPPQNYTVTADDAVIQIIGDTYDGGGQSGGSVTVRHRINSGTEISQNGFDSTQNGLAVNISYYTGPAANGASGYGTNNGSLSAGDVVNYTYNSGEGGSGIYSRRRSGNTLYDITFTNNNSTGDTYTLASSSTGYSTKSSYAAGDSQKVKDDSSSNQWTIAYDNISGAGPGTAGDIGVTETSAFTGSLEGNTTTRALDSSTTNGQQVQVTYTVLASDSVLILVGGGADNRPGDDPPEYVHAWNSTGVYNSGSIAGGIQRFLRGPAYQSGDYSNLTFSGTVSTGNLTVTSQSGTNSGFVRVSTARRAAQYTTIFTNNSGSKSYTLGSSSTGGAATLAAGATRNAQTTNSSNSNWAVYFDTSSGNCNTNIPTTIGSGNSVNLDLFNAPGTPVG